MNSFPSFHLVLSYIMVGAALFQIGSMLWYYNIVSHRSVVVVEELVALLQKNFDPSTQKTTTIAPTTSLSSSGRLAVTRTFCSADALLLSNSFDVWSDFAPCDAAEEAIADLFLVFSQSLATSAIAQEAVDSVTAKFHATNGWNNCFGRLVAIGVDIDPLTDVYNPNEQGINVMWVNGPNRQFERTIREVQSGLWGNYESMYLMEMDSVPVKSNWLDAIVEEMSANRPFAILGSKYRGDKWDSFYSQLPIALVNHINGNAIYNLTHPLFNLLVDELEEEAPTVANFIPYDYRMEQIMQEGRTGIAPEFPDGSATTPFFQKTARFQTWMQEYDHNGSEGGPIKEATKIGNYAATNMLPIHFGEKEVVIHGATMYEPWNSKEMGDITLVVSDWEDSNAKVLLSYMSSGKHPFSRVVVMLPSQGGDIDLPPINVPTEIYHRTSMTSPSSMDMCSAPIVTKWFMMTDSYHRVRSASTMNIMVARATTRSANGAAAIPNPVISYAPANEDNCYRYGSCARDMAVAREINPQASFVFGNDDMIFDTTHRNGFCDMWSTQFLNKNDVDEKTTATPSATAYVAYLQQKSIAHLLYEFTDRTLYGSRSVFSPLPLELLTPNMRTQLVESNVKGNRKPTKGGSQRQLKSKRANIGSPVLSTAPSMLIETPSLSPSSAPSRGKGGKKGGTPTSTGSAAPTIEFNITNVSTAPSMLIETPSLSSSSAPSRGKGGKKGGTPTRTGSAAPTIEFNITNVTCTLHTTEEACLGGECEWRPQFNSCRVASSISDGVPERSESARSGGISGLPLWAKAIIGIVIAAGCVAAIGLFGMGVKRRFLRDNVESAAVPHQHPSHDNSFVDNGLDTPINARSPSAHFITTESGAEWTEIDMRLE